ncbi:MAG: SDR family NAD(P)-dependent oxidoreductase [Hyphomicrobiaceae bacterium]
MSGRLQGKVAIVTGGARGIGEATVRLFAVQGAAVVIADQSDEEAVPVAASINAAGGRAEFVQCDVTRESDWVRLIERTLAMFGQLSVLVNNAGIGGKTVGDHDKLEGWQQLMTTNAQSVFLGTKHAATVMRAAGRGSIVNVSSIIGIVAHSESHPGYAASKAAVRHYTKAAACRYGPSGVRVNSVHPGFMPPMRNGSSAGIQETKVPLTPLRRTGLPIEVAHGILFLASDEASFITGAELVIDGGFVVQ